MPARQTKEAYEYYYRDAYVNIQEKPREERADLHLAPSPIRLDTLFRQRFKMFSLTFAVLVAALTLLNSFVACQGYMLSNSRSELRQLNQENEMLKIDIAKMKSPQRIQQIATKELGMSVPNKSYYAGEIGR